MTKYQEYFQKMLDENSEVFEQFRQIHQKYQEDFSHQDEFNNIGKPIISLIREYEDRLCRQTEGGGYAAYSGNLAEKFWQEIRKEFPLIDRVGIVVKKVVVDAQDNDFEIKKIDTFQLKKIHIISD